MEFYEIALVAFCPTLLFVGLFIRGCVVFVGNRPEHQLQYLNRETMMGFSMRYALRWTIGLCGASALLIYIVR